jgi:hypothetical protein
LAFECQSFFFFLFSPFYKHEVVAVFCNL